MGDSHAALFGHAGWRNGLVKATYGTGSSVMAVSGRRADQASGLCETIAWQIGSEPVRAVEGNIRASGATLAWLAQLTSTSPAQLASIAANAKADGVHLVPGFNGLGAPWWDPGTTGLVTGLTLGTKLENVARAALESVAFQVNDLLIAIRDATGEVGVLSVDGGAAANSSLMQLQADLSGISVLRPKTAGSVGARCRPSRRPRRRLVEPGRPGCTAATARRVHARHERGLAGSVNSPRGVLRSAAPLSTPSSEDPKEDP